MIFEFQPIAAADVAVQNLADMKREAKAEAFDGVIVVGMTQGFDLGAGFARSVENAAADLRRIGAVLANRKYGQ